MKRSGKWYRRNEEEVMDMLGLDPTANSGSGWIEKEDGQNDNVICQLKSTDKQQITLHLKDIETLEKNALVAHKLPVFAVQFIQNGKVYVMMEPQLLPEVTEYLRTGVVKRDVEILDLTENDLQSASEEPTAQAVRSSRKARERFMKENDKKYEKKERSAI